MPAPQSAAAIKFSLGKFKSLLKTLTSSSFNFLLLRFTADFMVLGWLIFNAFLSSLINFLYFQFDCNCTFLKSIRHFLVCIFQETWGGYAEWKGGIPAENNWKEDCNHTSFMWLLLIANSLASVNLPFLGLGRHCIPWKNEQLNAVIFMHKVESELCHVNYQTWLGKKNIEKNTLIQFIPSQTHPPKNKLSKAKGTKNCL